jgi:branched-chain amino acid aminotransferase
MYSFVNNKFVPADKAFLHASDLSIQRGYGIFDFLKIVDGHPFFLDDYMDRFFRSASIMRLAVPLTRPQLVQTVFELIDRNKLTSSGIKIILTGGYSTDGYTPAVPNLLLSQHELTLPSAELQQSGVSIITHEYVRDFPEVKTINYTMGIWLIERLKIENSYDVLYHKDGQISEFPRSNFFIVRKDNTVVTASKNVLYGVTRKNVLRLATECFSAIEGDISMEDLYEASEAFITSTTKRILPVVKVDGRVVGNGKPGPVSMVLLQKLIELENVDKTTSVKIS